MELDEKQAADRQSQNSRDDEDDERSNELRTAGRDEDGGVPPGANGEDF